MRLPESTPVATGLSGYLHPQYAASLAEFGRPRHLPASNGWVLQRPVATGASGDTGAAGAADATGPYPLFFCERWSRLPDDLEALAPDLVSVALVTDPFGDYRQQDLERWFAGVVVPFKRHYVVDLRRQRRDYVSDHHRRNARRALEQVEVGLCPEPLACLDEWVRLYDILIARHNITGIRRFSRRAFARQLQVPGLLALRARYEGETVAMLLWYLMGDVAYYHLGASSPAGYQLGASFALFWEAIATFAARGLSWLNLGAGPGAGAGDRSEDGLSRFKRGWATGTRTAYFCGAILNRARYRDLVQQAGRGESTYFPAYRHGEFH